MYRKNENNQAIIKSNEQIKQNRKKYDKIRSKGHMRK